MEAAVFTAQKDWIVLHCALENAVCRGGRKNFTTLKLLQTDQQGSLHSSTVGELAERLPNTMPEIQEHDSQVKAIKDLVQRLPKPNYDTMKILFAHLQKKQVKDLKVEDQDTETCKKQKSDSPISCCIFKEQYEEHSPVSKGGEDTIYVHMKSVVKKEVNISNVHCRIAAKEKTNLMSSQSLGIVFGPTLLRPEKETGCMAIHMLSKKLKLIKNRNLLAPARLKLHVFLLYVPTEFFQAELTGRNRLEKMAMEKKRAPFEKRRESITFKTFENLNEFKSCKSPKIFSLFGIAMKQGDYLLWLSSTQSYLGNSGSSRLKLLL
ncbi:hypothetical protein L345_11508, partial [Ophiophagus hannah]